MWEGMEKDGARPDEGNAGERKALIDLGGRNNAAAAGHAGGSRYLNLRQ